MKHGPRCDGCRVTMHVEENEYVCPECGGAQPIERVSDDLTARAPEPFNPKAMFDKMRRAVGE